MQSAVYSGAWGAARAHLAINLKNRNNSMLVLAADSKQADLLRNELSFFYNGEILIFPEYMHEPFEEVRIRPDISAQRVYTLQRIIDGANAIIITTPYAAAKKIAPPEYFIEAQIRITKGDIIPQEELLTSLDRLGYLAVEAVTGAGEFCLRGGMLDLFPLVAENPVRIEYFDDEIDSIFSYHAETRKKLSELDEITLSPMPEVIFTTAELADMPKLSEEIREKIENFGKYAGYHWLTSFVYDKPATIFDYLPEDIDIILPQYDWDTLFERLLVSAGDKFGGFAELPEIKGFFGGKNCSVVSDIVGGESVSAGYRSIKARFAFEKGNLYYALTQTLREIKLLHEDGLSVVIALESERFTGLLRDFCRDHEIPVSDINYVKEAKLPQIYIYNRRVSGGFISESHKLALITDEEIFGFVRKKSRTKPREAFSTNISDLEEGDFVVHIDYGIGIYKGLKHMTMGDIEGDYLEMLYENDEILYVPLERISQIQKYVGIGDAKPRLSSLQSATWSKLKTTARKQAAKIAQDLLKLYAERKARKGFAFPEGGSMLTEFEEHFEYDETEDQLAAILDVYRDMENETPMERLVCGDVGFGKTEVAMRAACKAVIAGKQAAVLVPTTVLARQHYVTFKKRFEGLPVNIDYLSRFRTSEEVKKIKTDLSAGKIDILIGTHRMLSADIQFNDLRLLVIDEEQRFGVAHKEKIAAMRSNIDVLALSATPIPRTLQLSLSGIRDMSVIETPPENRLPVIVKVMRHGEEVRAAMLRELERGGQIFFLHNRIKDMHEVFDYVKNLVPQANIAVAHGQTPAAQLENILKAFYEGEIDILVSTTIIENGIDIPNVNAIFIDNAANFGLSQLYQLKGRVGRSQERGYCYLLADNFQMLPPIAKKRLGIIQQLSELGSGMKIAMYDLQLRGAGDILGAAQSGFVTKVGYELFIKMIAEAVAELQQVHKSAVEAEIVTQYPHYISAEYIEDPRVRLDYYRTFAAVSDRCVMESLFDELKSQYGDLRSETVQLGYIMLIKNLATDLGVTKASIYPKMLRLHFLPSGSIPPEVLMAVAGRLKLNFRFAGEYEFVLSFAGQEETLPQATTFLEVLGAQVLRTPD